MKTVGKVLVVAGSLALGAAAGTPLGYQLATTAPSEEVPAAVTPPQAVPTAFVQWLAFVDDTWRLRVADRQLWLGVRKDPDATAPEEKFHWYLWEPPHLLDQSKEGKCVPISQRTALILIRHYADPHLHPILRSAFPTERDVPQPVVPIPE